ncbi:MAG: hypothetical protein WCB85_07255 [Candidatus Dormiibacterota bacterium]
MALDQAPLAVDGELEEDVVEVATPELLGMLVLLPHALINAPVSRQAMTAPASLVRRVATCKPRALLVTSSPFFVVRPEGEYKGSRIAMPADSTRAVLGDRALR